MKFKNNPIQTYRTNYNENSLPLNSINYETGDNGTVVITSLIAHEISQDLLLHIMMFKMNRIDTRLNQEGVNGGPDGGRPGVRSGRMCFP